MCLRKATLLLLFPFVMMAGGSDIIYPGQLDHAEGDECATLSSGTGTCSTSCGHSAKFGEPRKCGIKDSTFLVCCDNTLSVDPQRATDIAPPVTTFQCGINKKNKFTLKFSYVDDKKIYAEYEDVDPIIRYNVTETLANGTEVVRPVGVGGVGAERAEKNAWPWMALVGERKGGAITWFCGGVLINEQWVLSALHCFSNKKAVVVRLGEHNYKDDNDGASHKDFDVIETVAYPGYTHPEGYHDLALLRLNAPVPIQEFINPVCLPWALESEVNIIGHNVTLTGYGDTEFGGFPTSYLQEVFMTAFSSARCNSSYSTLPHYADTWPRGIGQETLCAGHPDGGRDACQGDSGGPLMSQDTTERFVLAGIVSRGYGCGHKDYPGLYANLRHPPYLAWVKKVAFIAS